MMLTENAGVSGACTVRPSLARDEAYELEALSNTLPEGWVVELQPVAGMAWAAFVYQADSPRRWPMFTVCRWNDRVGLFTQWMNGSASSAIAFTELWPIRDLILDAIFAFTQAHLTIVQTEGSANAQH